MDALGARLPPDRRCRPVSSVLLNFRVGVTELGRSGGEGEEQEPWARRWTLTTARPAQRPLGARRVDSSRNRRSASLLHGYHHSSVFREPLDSGQRQNRLLGHPDPCTPPRTRHPTAGSPLPPVLVGRHVGDSRRCPLLPGPTTVRVAGRGHGPPSLSAGQRCLHTRWRGHLRLPPGVPGARVAGCAQTIC